MPSVEEFLRRWSDAGLIDEVTAERIRAFEQGREQPAGLRWQVLLALAFGGLLLAAGVTLFVAAHWDQLSPWARFFITLLMIVVLHGTAIFAGDRFASLAITLHAVGTIAAGAAVFLVGQIFNIQEHWPAGILLWALCAMAGWALLGDEAQQTLTLLLLPVWIVSEWWVRSDGYRGSDLFAARMAVSFAALYLTAFIATKKNVVFSILFAAAAASLTIATVLLSESWSFWYNWAATPAMPWHLAIIGWGWIVAVPLLAAAWLKRAAMLPVAVVILSSLLLPHLFRQNPGPYAYPQSSVLTFLCIGLLACFLTWWGVRERSRPIINYGIFAFAATVLWFYFSSVMDKLDRSFSLILLGLLFLGGGWLLEKMRRRLVRHAMEAAA